MCAVLTLELAVSCVLAMTQSTGSDWGLCFY